MKKRVSQAKRERKLLSENEGNEKKSNLIYKGKLIRKKRKSMVEIIIATCKILFFYIN